MEEADHLCDRVAIMDNGKIIACDPPAVLKRSIGKLEVIEVKATGIPKALPAKLRRLRGVKEVVQTSKGLRLLTPTADAIIGQVVSSITSKKVRIDSLNVVQPTLEDVFIKLTGKTLRD
jgi:ABC-2 type transport system ATP-binding protein